MKIVSDELKKLIGPTFNPIPRAAWRAWFLAHPWFPMPDSLRENDDATAGAAGNDAGDQRQGESERSD